MSRPGQKPLEALIASIAGLSALYPDPTVNETGHIINGSLAQLVRDLIGDDAAEGLFEDAINALAPRLQEQFGIQVVTIAKLEKQAKTETDDLLTKLRKGGL